MRVPVILRWERLGGRPEADTAVGVVFVRQQQLGAVLALREIAAIGGGLAEIWPRSASTRRFTLRVGREVRPQPRV